MPIARISRRQLADAYGRLRVSGERTGLYLVSPNKKSEKADGIIPPHVEKHGSFEDYAAEKAMDALRLLDIRQTALSKLYISEARCATFKSDTDLRGYKSSAKDAINEFISANQLFK